MSIYFKPEDGSDIVVETPRLHITAYRKSDLKRVMQCLLNPRLCRRVGATPKKYIGEVEDFISDNIRTFIGDTYESVRLAIRDKDTQEYLGNIGIYKAKDGHLDIGYFLHPDAEGKGYMTEALTPIVDKLRHMGKVLQLEIRKSNKRSIRIAEKLGFKVFQDLGLSRKYR